MGGGREEGRRERGSSSGRGKLEGAAGHPPAPLPPNGWPSCLQGPRLHTSQQQQQ